MRRNRRLRLFDLQVRQCRQRIDRVGVLFVVLMCGGGGHARRKLALALWNIVGVVAHVVVAVLQAVRARAITDALLSFLKLLEQS